MFQTLDFVYMPSRDVARDVRYFTDSLGGELVFAIEAFGTKVAMVQLTEASPSVLLAEHLQDDRPVLVYRVRDLEAAIAELRRSGAELGERFGIPHGPGVEVLTPGPQRIALYQRTRPQAADRLAGRREF